MAHSALALLTAAALIADLLAVAYALFALARVMGHRGGAGKPSAHTPAVSVLKPLHGGDFELYENLRSFCEQEYPAFQVIFGVHDDGDPALPIVERVMRAFPERDLTLVIGGTADHANPKVQNLANMLGSAKHEILVIADSDMRVDPSYLRAVVAPFAAPNVGAVTCLYCGEPSPGIPSALAAMHLQEEFAPSVLVATALQGLRFCLGATMAVRSSLLTAIGGFAALGPYLADDYMLGKLVRERGRRVALSPYVVRNVIAEPSFGALWRHELRWARTIRMLRPLGYACSFLTFGISLALIYLLLARGAPLAIALLGAALVIRLALHGAVPAALPGAARLPLWLVPVRDVLSFAVWAAGLAGAKSTWRGRRISIRRDGKIGV
ncbi:MAG: bacteriohopanetetrol glucosamine biosynthesis glycosyltransferase HpnI [bacterium]|nr:bacteriohopanetetrol glucosamine biosynthesis glycosyltransferase HpnI [bacterium]